MVCCGVCCKPLLQYMPDKTLARDLVQVFITFLLSFVPIGFYYLFDKLLGYDVTGIVYYLVIAFLLFIALMIVIECFLANFHGSTPRPKEGEQETPASAIICAYMPNEQNTIMDTVEHFLKIQYHPGLQVILAYNTPKYCLVEAKLQELAVKHPQFLLLKVDNSSSKAQNLNSALEFVTGDFVGIFDADHHPELDTFCKAFGWLSNGFDVVQGHCLVRNPLDSFVAKMVAVEFEMIYSVSHPGRATRDGFGIFGGSNGYWRTDLLKEIGMHGQMLTEDIDSSMRTLRKGCKIASDPFIVSHELATSTWRQLWNQRLRWAQGWTQVSMKHFFPLLFSKHFNLRQKFGVLMILFLREIYPWVSSQIPVLVVYWYTFGYGVEWKRTIFLILSGWTAAIGPASTLISYHLSHLTIKKWDWYLMYGVFSLFMYTEFKNVITRVGHMKQLMGEAAWRVTPRSAKAEVVDEGITTMEEFVRRTSSHSLVVDFTGLEEKSGPSLSSLHESSADLKLDSIDADATVPMMGRIILRRNETWEDDNCETGGPIGDEFMVDDDEETGQQTRTHRYRRTASREIVNVMPTVPEINEDIAMTSHHK